MEVLLLQMKVLHFYMFLWATWLKNHHWFQKGYFHRWKWPKSDVYFSCLHNLFNATHIWHLSEQLMLSKQCSCTNQHYLTKFQFRLTWVHYREFAQTHCKKLLVILPLNFIVKLFIFLWHCSGILWPRLAISLENTERLWHKPYIILYWNRNIMPNIITTHYSTSETLTHHCHPFFSSTLFVYINFPFSLFKKSCTAANRTYNRFQN